MVRLARLPRAWAILLALVMVTLVGVFDYVTGFDFHVDAFISYRFAGQPGRRGVWLVCYWPDFAPMFLPASA